MEIKILQVFYDKNGLPYKDKERTVHYPITSGTFLGASNTTQIRFYYDQLDELNESTFVAVSKLPNGKIGSEILESDFDEELNENYVTLSLSQFYTQYKGDVYISLQGYQGGDRVEKDENGIYQIYGTPTIQATGSIKLSIAYAPTFIGSGETENITLQRVLAELSTKLGIRQETLHVEELPTIGNPNVWYVVNNDPNDITKANIYIWNATTQTYVWVGDNTLNLGDYYTTEQGQEFEEEIDQRITNVENTFNGSPKGVYATLSDLESAYPTGTNGVYVVSADGHWYYWNDTNEEWTDGGTYQATEIADNSIENKKISPNLRLETILNNVNYAQKPIDTLNITYGNSTYVYFTQNLNGNVKVSFDVVCSDNYGQLNINGDITLEITGTKQRKVVILNNYNDTNIYFRGYTEDVTFDVSNINISLVSDNVNKFSILTDIDTLDRQEKEMSNSLGKDYVDITSELNFNLNGYYRYFSLEFISDNDVKTAILKVYKGEKYRITGNSYYNGNLYLFVGETTTTAFPNDSNNTLYKNQLINISEDGLLIIVKPNSQSNNFKLEKYTYIQFKDLFDEYYENQQMPTRETGYIKNDGTLDTTDGFHIAIDVLAKEKYQVFAQHGWSLSSAVLVDTNNNVVAYYPNETVATVTDIITIDIPTNGTLYVNTFNYKLFGVAKYVDFRDIKSNNPLYKKSIVFFGDSITDNIYSWASTFEIRNKNNMTNVLCNQGKSGSQYCVTQSSSVDDNINLRVKSLDGNYDYIILSGGANDCGRNNTIGSLTSAYDSMLDTSTFYGSLEDTIRWLLKNKLNCKFGFVITPRIKFETDQDNYVKAIKQVCQKYAIPYLDLCDAGGLTSEYNEITAECYNAVDDYYHPNKKGYALINNKVEQFIKSL